MKIVALYMTEIPVKFEYKGREYEGHFSPVSGAGTSSIFHLTVDGLHWGQFWYVAGSPGFAGGLHATPAGWRFSSNTVDLSHLVDYFEQVIVGWYE